MTAAPGDFAATFVRLGGEHAVRRLAEAFYDAVDAHEAGLARMHPQDPGGRVARATRDRFSDFLVEWLGGPTLYSEAHGHAGLRERHHRVRVDGALRDAWLRAMTRALDTCAIDGEIRASLEARFRDAADRLVAG